MSMTLSRGGGQVEVKMTMQYSAFRHDFSGFTANASLEAKTAELYQSLSDPESMALGCLTDALQVCRQKVQGEMGKVFF